MAYTVRGNLDEANNPQDETQQVQPYNATPEQGLPLYSPNIFRGQPVEGREERIAKPTAEAIDQSV